MKSKLIFYVVFLVMMFLIGKLRADDPVDVHYQYPVTVINLTGTNITLRGITSRIYNCPPGRTAFWIHHTDADNPLYFDESALIEVPPPSTVNLADKIQEYDEYQISGLPGYPEFAIAQKFPYNTWENYKDATVEGYEAYLHGFYFGLCCCGVGLVWRIVRKLTNHSPEL